MYIVTVTIKVRNKLSFFLVNPQVAQFSQFYPIGSVLSAVRSLGVSGAWLDAVLISMSF